MQVTSDVYSGPNVYYADTTLVPGTWYTYTVNPLERGYPSNTIGPFKPRTRSDYLTGRHPTR